MSESLAFLISGTSIIFSGGIIYFFKNKYSNQEKNYISEQKKIDNEKINLFQKETNEIKNNLFLMKENYEDLEKHLHILSNENNELKKDNLQFESKLKDLKVINTSTKEKKSKKSILIVDDSIVIRTKMSKFLTGEGYDITLANDGLDGLKALENKKYDLIITDLEMPNLDGFGFIIKAKENIETKETPIIIITGHEQIKIDIANMENLVGVYKKPWEEPELLRKINFLCSLNN